MHLPPPWSCTKPTPPGISPARPPCGQRAPPAPSERPSQEENHTRGKRSGHVSPHPRARCQRPGVPSSPLRLSQARVSGRPRTRLVPAAGPPSASRRPSPFFQERLLRRHAAPCPQRLWLTGAPEPQTHTGSPPIWGLPSPPSQAMRRGSVEPLWASPSPFLPTPVFLTMPPDGEGKRDRQRQGRPAGKDQLLFSQEEGEVV